mmetsp:Transcript_27861/g.47361  ORF Transcript_27861/g.47361 Transcript_27861/m.47361 type:complete len:89 (-) Transcript_27861:650-916(-)
MFWKNFRRSVGGRRGDRKKLFILLNFCFNDGERFKLVGRVGSPCFMVFGGALPKLCISFHMYIFLMDGNNKLFNEMHHLVCFNDVRLR